MIYGETWNPGGNKKALEAEGGIRIAKRYSIRASKLFGEEREGRWLYVCIRSPSRFYLGVWEETLVFLDCGENGSSVTSQSPSIGGREAIAGIATTKWATWR
ncbi:hypothetical protein M747DRAFT_47365 [Aspergillus niger ATCC 13496]|uniref:Uncharacterized protein n=1 Tax=Aspergillus niger ATCC 13496 TaxID=1353008 RepID=A0A370C0B8_ASPNG|nr:hypothetical protein M747DRAFT_47365 [Aspergillus niger ATCC 13496]